MSASLCYNRTGDLVKYSRAGGTAGSVAHNYRGVASMSILSRKITGIYKITNLVNGKCYIGQSVDIRKRFYSHKNGYEDSPISRAIKKYGVDAFLFEILEKCHKESLDELERICISQFNSIRPHGYNIESGGNSQKVIPLAQRKNHSIFMTGNSNRNIAINQYSLEGSYITTYDSAVDASRSTGAKSSAISGCCKNKKGRKSCGGYLWSYASDCQPGESIAPYSRDFVSGPTASSMVTSKPVNQYTIDGKYIRTFQSCADTDSYFNTGSHGHVNDCCNGKRKTAYGYLWRFA